MKYSITKILIFPFVIILSGCATNYKPINPPTLDYNLHDLQDKIELSLKYDVLVERGNKKYAKKEIKKGIKLIAIKATNNTDTIINIGRNAAFYSGQDQIFPMEPMEIKESIKQIVPGYLGYLLLIPFFNITYTESSNGIITKREVYHIGYVFGPAITIGNMAVAGSANKNMLNELYKYNILNRDIEKGETVYGIIGVRDMGSNPILLKMIK